MFGVMREILDNEGASMRGDDDFFSVARTMPFVAIRAISIAARLLSWGRVVIPLIPNEVTP